MRSRFSCATFSGWRKARDTVMGDTPASLATSSMRGGLAGAAARAGAAAPSGRTRSTSS